MESLLKQKIYVREDARSFSEKTFIEIYDGENTIIAEWSSYSWADSYGILSRIKFSAEWETINRNTRIWPKVDNPENELLTREQNFFATALPIKEQRILEEVINNHLKEFDKIIIRNLHDVQDVLDARSTYLGWENRHLAFRTKPAFLPVLKNNPELLEKVIKIHYAFYHYQYCSSCSNDDLSIPIKDLDFTQRRKTSRHLDNIYFDCPGFERLNVPNTPKIIEEIYKLTVKQLKELNPKLTQSGSIKSSLLILEKFLSGTKDETFDPADGYMKIVSKINNSHDSTITFGSLNYLQEVMEHLVDYPYVGNALVKYFLEKDVEWNETNLGRIIRICSLNFVSAKTMPIVAENLLNRMSFEEYLKWVEDFRKTGIKLTNNQWLTYFENYDDYKDYPVEWWVSLLTKKAI